MDSNKTGQTESASIEPEDTNDLQVISKGAWGVREGGGGGMDEMGRWGGKTELELDQFRLIEERN